MRASPSSVSTVGPSPSLEREVEVGEPVSLLGVPQVGTGGQGVSNLGVHLTFERSDPCVILQCHWKNSDSLGRSH